MCVFMWIPHLHYFTFSSCFLRPIPFQSANVNRNLSNIDPKEVPVLKQKIRESVKYLDSLILDSRTCLYLPCSITDWLQVQFFWYLWKNNISSVCVGNCFTNHWSSSNNRGLLIQNNLGQHEQRFAILMGIWRTT